MVWLLYKAQLRLELSLAKHRSLAGHPRNSRRLSRLIPFYEYPQEQVLAVDGATPEVSERRRLGLRKLETLFTERFNRSRALTRQTKNSVSDLRFTGKYRVPFQFRRLLRGLTAGSFLQSSSGVTVTDLDGNQFFDLTGSYGVNLFGYDFYRQCIERAVEHARDLGPVLGSYHPLVALNAQRLREISQLDEVSFHMSGTQAVMQAVRLARYHTGRTHVVTFCGAYHGWWGDVQPGVGNPIAARQTYTLAEMSEATLRVLRRRKDIACVLVNPLQALHPNTPAPSDSTLVDSSRKAHFDRVAYTVWLEQLRRVCTRAGIVLIFDEVFVGFRLARGGAQEYFGVRADMVTYGKTLGGGLPIGALCGRAHLMKRYRDERPADICFARGTFNSHPYVMAAAHEFLNRIADDNVATLYATLDETWDERARRINARLEQSAVPVRIANLSSIWTICYTKPACYNWMFQFYLRAEGLALSWVGTGRLIFSLDYTDADFGAVVDRFVAAAKAMQADGWSDGPATSNQQIRRRISREILRHRFGFSSTAPAGEKALRSVPPAKAEIHAFSRNRHQGIFTRSGIGTGMERSGITAISGAVNPVTRSGMRTALPVPKLMFAAAPMRIDHAPLRSSAMRRYLSAGASPKISLSMTSSPPP
ncbi:glutamate-1-semialdehyde 2,1-aminomutase [Povalibacter uvarum]|uniref:Glutamate-1-semialdehyde 2,1-aminomutase n=1 Tax=Povalibacter uvarum TaxID=732238 RepID=A0A841HI88_9GAMM|nr:glutamate-1-semialdehyde 2,1-aminomutase [Povalibacter uvarum]